MTRVSRRAVLAAALVAPGVAHAAGTVSAGRLVEYPAFPSDIVAARRVSVWLPPSYDDPIGNTYPVLYMHDGQNLFIPGQAAFGVEWGVDEHVTVLARERELRETIVVGVWNTPARYQEYFPTDVLKHMPRAVQEMVRGNSGAPLIGDDYLRFLVTGLKPYIDRTFRTQRGVYDTAVMGSSMGGLISLYAFVRYPEVFGKAGCVSTHWPLTDPNMVAPHREGMLRGWASYLDETLPRPQSRRLYFDHGTLNLDSNYAPYQQAVDAAVLSRGYERTRSFMSRGFDGADHNERSWNERLDIPLRFLLGAGVRP